MILICKGDAPPCLGIREQFEVLALSNYGLFPVGCMEGRHPSCSTIMLEELLLERCPNVQQ